MDNGKKMVVSLDLDDVGSEINRWVLPGRIPLRFALTFMTRSMIQDWPSRTPYRTELKLMSTATSTGRHSRKVSWKKSSP